MDKIVGIIIDHNETGPFYIIWVKGVDQRIFEVVTYYSNGVITFCRNNNVENHLKETSKNEFSVCPMDIRSFILQCMINKTKVIVTGESFQSDHINPRTRMENVGISFLQFGGSIFYQTEDDITVIYKFPKLPRYKSITNNTQYLLPLNHIGTPISEVKIVKHTKDFFIVKLPITIEQSSEIKVKVDGNEKEYLIISSSDVEKTTTIQFPSGKTASILGNFTPNGFPTLTLWQF